MYMRKVESFLSNKNVLIISVISLLLLGFHVYQYIDSGFMLQPLTRAIFYFVNIAFLFLFGLKAEPYLLLSFGLVLALQMSFDNYSAFVLVTSAIMIVHKRKFTIVSILLYLICVFVVCTIHKKTGIHIAVHLLGCAFLVVIGKLIFESGAMFEYQQYKDNYKKVITDTFGDKKGNIVSNELNLTSDEYFLLHEIVIDCKPLKALGKPNTISKKIKKCYEKNGLKSTSELYEKYLRLVESEIKSIKVDVKNQQESNK